jgi:dihydrofolate reductase
MAKIYTAAIVAMASNNVIGRDNALIWHIPEDLKHFKRTTLGKPLVMGRKTYASLGKPLPGRANIVISRSGGEEVDENGPFYVDGIEQALDQARARAERANVDEVFIIGGGEIYKQTLPLLDRLYLTLVHEDFEGDASFPDFDWDDWKIISEERHSENQPPFTIYKMERD